MTARDEVVDFWDEITARWLTGEDPLPDPLPRWFQSYRGRGDGVVTRDAFAEPYIGDLRGQARFVMLGLNPGQAEFDFQARDGLFAEEIRRCGSYSDWGRTAPYVCAQWEAAKGPNRYTRTRLQFARRWTGDPSLGAGDLLLMELYPWHSTRVTGQIAPPAEIIEQFVWRPLAEHPVEFMFAFGKPWLRVCGELGLPVAGRWGQGGQPLGSSVASRSVVVFELPSGQQVVVSSQLGYAGPPGPEDTLRIRSMLLSSRIRG